MVFFILANIRSAATPWSGDEVLLGNPDSKVHGANMGPIWGRQDPGGPHVGPMNFAVWEKLPNTHLSILGLW